MDSSRLSVRTHPALCRLIERDMTQVAAKRPKVLSLISAYTRMPEGGIRTALAFASGPPVDLTTRICYGHTPVPHVIQIGDIFAKQYEALVNQTSVGNATPQLRAAASAAVVLMESKLLHELVHWAWGNANPARPEPPSRHGFQDMGWDFEADFYGRPLTATSMSIGNYINVPGLP